MVRGYRDKRTREFAEGRFVKALQGIRRQAERRLEILDAALSIEDLKALRSNRFKALSGDRKGQYSIRINDQFRICFEWSKGGDGPDNVEITDYH
jgi:proteic killer suppression protein